jgi:putative flippase GtrA
MSYMSTALQFARYVLVGLLSNVILYFAYLTLTAFGVEAKLAMTALYIVGVAQTFMVNKRWTFDHRAANKATFVRYCISYALGYVINLLVLYILVDYLGYAHQFVQGMMVFGLAVMLFFLQKIWVFPTNSLLPTSETVQS